MVLKFLKKSLLIVMTLALVAEVYLRMIDRTEYGYLEPVMRANNELGFTFIPGGAYSSGKHSVNFNDYGYIGRNWSLEKDSSKFRIAVVGTCVMTGVFHIKDTAYLNYPELTEKQLIQMGYNVEILNFAITGESRSYYNFRTIEQDIVRFNPDLVIMEDLLPYTKKDYVRNAYNGYQVEYLFTSQKSRDEALRWADALERWSFLVWVFDHSELIKRIALKYQHSYDNDIATFIKFADRKQVSFIDDAITSIYTMQKSIEMTRDLAYRLQQDSIDFSILHYQNYAPADSFLRNHFDHIYLYTKYKEEMFYPKDDHLNNLGQEHLAEKFVDELLDIISPKYKSP